MRVAFRTADVFTGQAFGGNPLAVFPDGQGLSSAQMQAVARGMNLSETVFVLPAADAAHAYKLRIFTPGSEVPFAGHPTIGTALVLARTGAIRLQGTETAVVFEEGIGPIPVTIRADDGAPVFAQLTTAKPPEIGPPAPSRTALAEMLGLEPADLIGGARGPQAVSCGLPFLLVPVRDPGVLARAHVRVDRWEATLASWWAPQLFLFAHEPASPGTAIRARMFAPGLGVPEDPATGSAAAALGGYLAARETTTDRTFRWTVEQGVEMGRPSVIEIEVVKAGGTIAAIRVGGAAVMVSEGIMDVPELPDTPAPEIPAAGTGRGRERQGAVA